MNSETPKQHPMHTVVLEYFEVKLFFVVLFLVPHCPLWEIWVTLPGYGTATTRAALPIPVGVCCIFMSKQCIWDF